MMVSRSLPSSQISGRMYNTVVANECMMRKKFFAADMMPMRYLKRFMMENRSLTSSQIFGRMYNPVVANESMMRKMFVAADTMPILGYNYCL